MRKEKARSIVAHTPHELQSIDSEVEQQTAPHSLGGEVVAQLCFVRGADRTRRVQRTAAEAWVKVYTLRGLGHAKGGVNAAADDADEMLMECEWQRPAQ